MEIAIIGNRGSGKSTLAKLLSDELHIYVTQKIFIYNSWVQFNDCIDKLITYLKRGSNK